jgi:hypothetical protein
MMDEHWTGSLTSQAVGRAVQSASGGGWGLRRTASQPASHSFYLWRQGPGQLSTVYLCRLLLLTHCERSRDRWGTRRGRGRGKERVQSSPVCDCETIYPVWTCDCDGCGGARVRAGCYSGLEILLCVAIYSTVTYSSLRCLTLLNSALLCSALLYSTLFLTC